MTPTSLDDAGWRRFQEQGYLPLGAVCEPEELKSLLTRIDDIMLGRAEVDYDRMLMQLDSETGRYEDAPAQTRGHKGATLAYRKIQDLEHDDAFLAFLQKPLFRDICARAHGPRTSISCMRAMFMNKPAGKGTELVWHQDRWAMFDRDPLITVWTALDPATVANGCVQILPSTHGALINPSHPSGFLTEAQVREQLRKGTPVPLEVPAGHAVLLHNWLLHSSGVNRSSIARRAFSVCYMDAGTKSSGSESYSVVFGDGAMSPRVHA
jgi:hypothetical protein